MTIPESPYQRLIDIIDLILVKNRTSQTDKAHFSVVEVPSLPQNGLGAKILSDTLKSFQQKGILPVFTVSGYIYLPKFDKVTEKKLLVERQALLEQSKGSEPHGEISLKDHKITFDDNAAAIMVGKLKCSLPPYKNEHYFCRAIFQYPVNEPVDWSVIFKEMTGSREDVPVEGKIRSIKDTMYALNNRIKKVINTDDALFTLENKSVRRNY